MLENTGKTVTKSTRLDKYLSRDEHNNLSWYQFICNSGYVPVVAGSTRTTWPLNEEYSRTMLLLHWPDWRTMSDIIKEKKQPGIQKWNSF